MKTSHKKLKLNIRGRFKKFWASYLLKRKARELGINLHSVEHPSRDSMHVTVSGEIKQLWKVVNWSQKCSLFFTTESLMLEFL